jgi:hypothetical protein
MTYLASKEAGGAVMAIEFNINGETQCVILELSNQSSLDEVQEKLPALISAIELLDRPLLLIDYIEDRQRPNPKRRAGIALFADQLNEHIKKVGISCRGNLRQDLASIVEVMRARKTPTQFFADRATASAWLMGGEG